MRTARIVSAEGRFDNSWEQAYISSFDDIQLELVSTTPDNESDLIRMAADADALLISAREAVTTDLLAALPLVRVIGRNSVGLDNIDLDAATKHSVVVTHYPQYCTHEVADHAIASIYALNRRLVEFDRALREGAWVRHWYHAPRILRSPILPLREMTLGIVGLGRIGQQVVQRMRASVNRVIVADPYIDPDLAASFDCELLPLDELLGQSDIVSLHCPLTPETRGLIDAAALARMKSTALLVNTARGPIVDPVALDSALEQGGLAGAALDVFTEEPLPLESPLFTHPNLIMTPHTAYYSERSVETVRRETLLGVIDTLRGIRPKVVANPAVLEMVALRPRDNGE